MLVSVTEDARNRSSEIDRRTRGAILFQFLAEAMAVVTLGGLIGVMTGWALTAGIGTLPLSEPCSKTPADRETSTCTSRVSR